MTKNLVAQFACSVWKSSESERAQSLGFSVGDFKEYPVIAGSIFNEEYNESLDSATIVLSQVQKEDRLIDIKPYQYVRVYDKSSYNETTQKYEFNKIFLVDNYNEQENNIYQHIFGYTILLMSETKWLEKFQCPNVTQTHRIVTVGDTTRSTKKTIYEYIEQYMKLYVPKIKYTEDNVNWDYVYLITVPERGTEEGEKFYNRFNVPCADMGSSAATLRQLLTMLMQQVGCIPTVHNRVLGFLDFQAPTHKFGDDGQGHVDYTVGHTVNSIRRSLSSDSYANTLVNMSENVLSL